VLALDSCQLTGKVAELLLDKTLKFSLTSVLLLMLIWAVAALE
jgi:hypothetical protein